MTTQEVPAQQLGNVMTPPRPPARRRALWLAIGLCSALLVAGAAIFFLVAVVVPFASAAGGCGGG